MALTRELRFQVKSELLEAIESDNQKWSFRKVNLLLSEYNCEPIPDYSSDYGFEDAIQSLNDGDLVSMYTLVLGNEPAGISPKTSAELKLDDTPIWQPGKLRVFLSHSAKHKKFAAEVADALSGAGVSGFVAHDSMSFDQSWQDQIELGLSTMDALVVLLHPEVNNSAWCQQEIGWGLGSGIPFYLVRLGVDPAGFIGRTQYPQVPADKPQAAAKAVLSWLASRQEFAAPLIDGLLSALTASESFIESMAITSRIAQLPSLTEEQWQKLDNAALDNDQVYRSGGACRNLEPFYRTHKRQWPPVKPQPVVAASPSWVFDPNRPF
ncbi:MAG: toll/interleukin-1 receptor domain-containing protein [Leucobacter sp.]